MRRILKGGSGEARYDSEVESWAEKPIGERVCQKRRDGVAHSGPKSGPCAGNRSSRNDLVYPDTVIDPPLGQSLPVVRKLCACHTSESAFPSVCGSKQVTIGFHLLILGWKDTELGDSFPIVRLTGLSEWWVDDGYCNDAFRVSRGIHTPNQAFREVRPYRVLSLTQLFTIFHFMIASCMSGGAESPTS